MSQQPVEACPLDAVAGDDYFYPSLSGDNQGIESGQASPVMAPSVFKSWVSIYAYLLRESMKQPPYLPSFAF
jgi:hypothetical protein